METRCVLYLETELSARSELDKIDLNATLY